MGILLHFKDERKKMPMNNCVPSCFTPYATSEIKNPLF